MSSEPALDIVTGIDRTIRASSLPPTVFIFCWPPNNTTCRMVVYCTDPHCFSNSFTQHPLLDMRAIRHFQSHGLDLKDSNAVIQLFGFKGMFPFYTNINLLTSYSDRGEGSTACG